MLIVALITTVVMLVLMGFFMLGSLPLLILKHDTPLDSHFIRWLFNLYYVGLMGLATLSAMSYLLVGKPSVALALGGVAVVGFAGRQWLVGHMDALRSTMTADDAAGIRRFRKLHIAGMLLNVLLLSWLCVGMTKVSL